MHDAYRFGYSILGLAVLATLPAWSAPLQYQLAIANSSAKDWTFMVDEMPLVPLGSRLIGACVATIKATKGSEKQTFTAALGSFALPPGRTYDLTISVAPNVGTRPTFMSFSVQDCAGHKARFVLKPPTTGPVVARNGYSPAGSKLGLTENPAASGTFDDPIVVFTEGHLTIRKDQYTTPEP